MGDVTRGGHDDVRRAVVGVPEAVDRLGRQRPDGLLGPGDLPAQRGVVEDRQVEQHVDVLGRVVEVRADLLDDDVALLLDLLLVEQGPRHELPEDGHRQGDVPPRHAHVIDGRLAVRRGVERPADPLDGLGQGAGRGERGGPLEGQVLHEVGAAGLVDVLVARAREDMRLDRDRPGSRKPGGDDARPVGQRRALEHRAEGIGNGACRPGLRGGRDADPPRDPGGGPGFTTGSQPERDHPGPRRGSNGPSTPPAGGYPCSA